MLLPSYFDRFLAKIEPSSERVAAVATAHGVLREHLLEDADLAFPVAESFLSGSYRRETAIDPIKDVDVVCLLSGYAHATREQFPAPADVFADVTAALDDFYEDVRIAQQRRSIGIALADEGVVLDVVLAIAPSGADARLYLPDRERRQWVPSHPKHHIAHATAVNDQSGGKFKPVAKAFKWWRMRLDETRRPKPFLVETLVAEEIVLDGENAADAFMRTLDAVVDRCARDVASNRVPRVEDPGLPGEDLSASCGWNLEDARWFLGELRGAQRLARAALAAPTKAESISSYQSLFGSAFPSADADGRAPQLPFKLSLDVGVAATDKGPFHEKYTSGSRKLPKGWWLRFVASTNAPPPYRFRWTVRNAGAEARRKGDINRVEKNKADPILS